MVADGGFMLSDLIGGNGGIPLVGEGKVGLEDGVKSRGVELQLDGRVKWLVHCR